MYAVVAATNTGEIIAANAAVLVGIIAATGTVMVQRAKDRAERQRMFDEAALARQAQMETLRRVEHGINHVDEEPADGVPHTLGQIVRQGFEANERAHALFLEVVHGHGQRLDALDRQIWP